MNGLASILFAAALAQSPLQPPAPTVGSRPPEFAAEGWLNSSPLTLESVRGSVVVIEVWAPWSNYSRKLIPEMINYHRRWKGAGVKFVTFSLDSPEFTRDVVQREGIDFPVGAGRSSPWDYGRFVPTLMVLDPDGFVTWVQCPVFPSDIPKFEQAVETAIRAAAGGRAATTTAPTGASAAPAEERPGDPRLPEAERFYVQRQYADAYLLCVQVAANPADPASGARAREIIGMMRGQVEVWAAARWQILEKKCGEYLKLARIEAADGDREAARRLYQRVIELHPDGADAALARRELEALGAGANETPPPRP